MQSYIHPHDNIYNQRLYQLIVNICEQTPLFRLKSQHLPLNCRLKIIGVIADSDSSSLSMPTDI